MDKEGNPVKGKNDQGQEVFLTAPKVMLPNDRLMMYLADRLIPREEDEPITDLPQGQTRSEQIAAAAERFELFSGAVRILLERGVPLPQLVGQELLEPPIETTATKVRGGNDGGSAPPAPLMP
jgi:hypothetical protein